MAPSLSPHCPHRGSPRRPPHGSSVALGRRPRCRSGPGCVVPVRPHRARALQRSRGCRSRAALPGCGHAEKPGACPAAAPEGLFYPCSFQCLEDGDCLGRKNCCGGRCARTCAPPGKPGFCPVSPGLYASYECQARCHGDGDCPAEQKCCRRGCDAPSCVTSLGLGVGTRTR
uniref:WAP domain-containing protein n=1 Tax=Nothoprocta perdicaria TaxID=30464 RepID=A0A8C6Z3R5_NOTPE